MKLAHKLYGLKTPLWDGIVGWLNYEQPPNEVPPCNFARLTDEIRPCDVLLVEGRSRVSAVIKHVTQSPWTHAALYIGRFGELADSRLNALITPHYAAVPREQLVLEAILGKGIMISPLSSYQGYHLRICRPQAIQHEDAEKVITHSVSRLGTAYDVRQLLDLARFLYPYAILPRRWQSSLFNYHAGLAARTVCSTMIAEAFMEVRYPILPVLKRSAGQEGEVQVYQRNPRLFSPKDFDYSPYFDIIKYPYYGTDVAMYKQMRWNSHGMLCDDENHCYIPQLIKEKH
jgi:hypothetical protein